MAQKINKQTLNQYRLDHWLESLGVWREEDSHHADLNARAKALKNIDFSRPLIISGSDFDHDHSLRLITAKSETSYDPQSGILEDKIIYWRHTPFADQNTPDKQEHHIISIRAQKNSKTENGIDIVIPDQIWVGGELFFCRQRGDDPTDPTHIAFINRIIELSRRTKEHLNRKKPTRDIAKVLTGNISNTTPDNILEEITKPIDLSGLDNKGGFQPSVTSVFFNSVHQSDNILQFDYCTLDQLKTILGFSYNTLEPYKNHTGNRTVPGTEMQSGIKYNTGVHYDFDPKNNKHSFSLKIEPVGHFDEKEETPPPFDIARIDFIEQKKNNFILDGASFMQHQINNLSSYEEKLNLIGFFQKTNEYLSRREYPPYRDLAARYRLTDHLNKMHTPPLLKDGGETLFLAINGSSFEKKVDGFGDGIGGGNMVMHRGVDEDGQISEISAIIDFPYASGDGSTDFDGMNPDYLEWWNSVEAICITHDHYDHATVEYYAHQGLLKHKTIYATEAVQEKLKIQMNNLGVRKDIRPQFQTIKGTGAFCLKDKKGNNRLWVQYCEDSTLHSARTTGFMTTGCYNDTHYGETFLFYGDGIDLTPKGWEWVNTGPRALANQNGVSTQKLQNKEIDAVFHDPTGIRYGGHAPRPKDVEITLRGCLEVLKDKTVIAVPFSTNHLEIQSLINTWNENDNVRNYTFVGSSAENRASILNKFGIEAEIDYTTIKIPYDKLPKRAYRCVVRAIEDSISSIENKYATEKKQKDISQSKALPFYHKLLEQAKIAIQNGDERPEFLYKGFLDGENTFSDLIDNTGNNAEKVLEDLNRIKRKTRKHLRKSQTKLLTKYKEDGIETENKTRYFMMRSLATHGKVKFLKNNLNSHNMYRAIMAQQAEASLYAGRSSKTALNFRKNPENLGIITTAPTGSAAESFGSLPRFAWSWSLFDTDTSVRNTGYPIDAKDAVFFVMQPAPPGAENAQDKLMQDLVRNRNVTIFCAIKNGFKIYNPKELHGPLTHQFKKLGWNTTFDHTQDQIQVHDQALHIHGHGFYNDVKNLVNKIPAKLHEIIHITDKTSAKTFQEMCHSLGKETSIKEHDDHIAYKFKNPTGEKPRLEITDHLTQSFWLIRIRRQYGRQYGGIVEMLRAIVMRNKGNKTNDGLDVRTSDEDDYNTMQPSQSWNKWLKPFYNNKSNGQSAKQRNMGPAEPQKQKGNNRPTGNIAFRPQHKKL